MRTTSNNEAKLARINILAAHIKRLMVIDEQPPSLRSDVDRQVDRLHVMDNINKESLTLNLGSFESSWINILDKVGLRADYAESLARQHEMLIRYMRQLSEFGSRTGRLAFLQDRLDEISNKIEQIEVIPINKMLKGTDFLYQIEKSVLYHNNRQGIYRAKRTIDKYDCLVRVPNYQNKTYQSYFEQGIKIQHSLPRHRGLFDVLVFRNGSCVLLIVLGKHFWVTLCWFPPSAA